MLKSPLSGLGHDAMTPTTYVNNFHVTAHKNITPQEPQPTGNSTHRKIIPRENDPDESHPTGAQSHKENDPTNIISQENHPSGNHTVVMQSVIYVE